MSAVFSYVRFSSKIQEQGDSVRRQTGLGDSWLKRHPEHTLDMSLRLRDLGVSAFRGKNLDKDKGDLGKFIALAKDGKIPPGSILMLENLDRFSRQAPRKAYRIFCELVECGIKVLTLNPEQLIDERNIDSMEVVLPVIIAMQLAYQESDKKAKRQVAAWEGKRQKAMTDGKPMTRRCRAWVSWDDKGGKWVVQPGARETIQFIFRRTVEGVGKQRILRDLQGKYKTFGKSKRWNSSMISGILQDRTVLGEFTPLARIKDRKAESIPDYYPRIISDDLFYQARAASTARRTMRGRCSGFVNLFTGRIFFNDGFAAHLQNIHRQTKKRGKLVFHRLFSAGHKDHVAGACPLSCEYGKIERHILAMLFQIKPSDLAPGKEPDPSAAKRAELSVKEARLRELRDALTTSNKPVSEIVAAIAELSTACDSIRKQIDALKGSQAAAKAKPLRGVQTISQMLERAPEAEQHDLRLKLRGLIAAVVERIELTPRKAEDGKTVESKISVVFKDCSIVGTLHGDTSGGLESAKVLRDVIRKLPAGVLGSARLVDKCPPTIAVRMVDHPSSEVLPPS